MKTMQNNSQQSPGLAVPNALQMTKSNISQRDGGASQPGSPGRRGTHVSSGMKPDLAMTLASGRTMSKQGSLIPARDRDGRTLIAPNVKTLATEFESFELLMFDIETRVRMQ